MKLKLLYALVLLLFAGNSYSAIVNYSEIIDGDLPDSSTQKIFLFDLGVNTISGSTLFTTIDFTTTFDRDHFRFIIQSGMILESITFAYDLNILENTIFLSDSRLLDALSANNSFFENDNTVMFSNNGAFPVEPSPHTLYSQVAAITQGTYSFTNSASKNGTGGEWDYTISFEVTAVPIPPAIWLFGSAILGLFASAKRKGIK